MTASMFAGPLVVSGPMFGIPGSLPDPNIYAGPSVFYQGQVLPDVRYYIQKDQQKVGGLPSHLDSPAFLLTDTTPAASAATPVNIAAAANVVSGTAMTLVTTTAAGITPGLQLVPFQSSASAVSVIGLDFGFATATTTAGNATLTPVRSNTATNAVLLFTPGQWICIGGAGNVAGTASLFTKVLTTGTSTITVSPAPAGSVTSAPIGSCNLYDPNIQAMQPALLPTGVSPYLSAGLSLVLNPLETCARCVGIGGSGSAVGGNFLVSGYSMYGEPMSERITAAAGTGPTYGKKAFKYVASVVPQFTDAHNYSVGTGDTFGFAIRSDFWEYMALFWNAASLTALTGWVAADLTSPATSTTGDSRGTLQVSTRGAGSNATATPANGSIRIAIFASIPVYNNVAATPVATAPMYGVTPA